MFMLAGKFVLRVFSVCVFPFTLTSIPGNGVQLSLQTAGFSALMGELSVLFIVSLSGSSDVFSFLVFYKFCASVCLSVFLPACLSVCLTEPCCFDFSWCVSEPMCSPRPVPLLELSPCTWASPTCRRRCAW